MSSVCDDLLSEFYRDMRKTHHTIDPLPAGEALPGGGSKSKSNKSKSKKPSLSTLNQQLGFSGINR